MSEPRPHLKTLEEIERTCVPGLVGVLRNEGIEGVRHAGEAPNGELRSRLSGMADKPAETEIVAVETRHAGTDVFTPEKRSEVMSRVRSKNTKPEVAVRSILHAMGYRFRLHRKDLPGKPDIVLPKHRTVVLVHGCFWHQHPGCDKATLPKRNAEFWREKLEGNVERDRRTRERLRELGWRVLMVWECEVKRTPHALAARLDAELRSTAGGAVEVRRS